MRSKFTFFDPGILVDDDLELVLVGKIPADPVTGYVPYYQFEMRSEGNATPLGSIRLRIGPARKLRYAGNIGYEVNTEHRSHRYAARSCRLILPLARAHDLKAVWLTVAPDNRPSQKTCLAAGAEYIETIRLPKDHVMYHQGSHYRRRYKLDL